MSDADKDDLAGQLIVAWAKYCEFFGQPPHGSYRQIRAMLELMPETTNASEKLGSELNR